MNYIERYHAAIKSHKVTVSKKVEKVYDKLVTDLHDEGSVWEYDDQKANHAIFFIEKFCKHSKGKMGGKPFILELWQLALIAAMFGFIHKVDGIRRFREVILIVARKNGKSTLAAAIGLYLMIADQEPGAEIYAVATKKDQAKIIWLEAKRMVRKSPVLLSKIKTLVAEMNSYFNDSVFRPLGSDSDTQDGLNVHGALLDEIHAWKNKNLYDVIVDGCTGREQPMIFITTTAGTIRESVYDMKYEECTLIINGYSDPDGYQDDRVLPIIYELDKRDEWEDPAAWAKANPGLDTIKNRSQLAAKVKKAQANPLLVKNLLCKDFNVRETASEAFLNFEQLNNTQTFDITAMKPRYGIGGFDLSQTIDLTCATVLFKIAPDDPLFYALQMYWIPEDVLEKRQHEDKVPYDLWIKNKWLRTCPGNRIDYHVITQWFLEVQEKYDIYLFKIGYDRYSAQYLVEEIKGEFGESVLDEVIQGARTLSAPLQNMAAELEAKHIIYNNNPVTKWCLANLKVQMDTNGNIKPIKNRSDKIRDDGAMSLLDAYVSYERNMEDYLNMI